MYNVAKFLAATAIAAAALTACSADNTRAAEADNLLSRARSCTASHDYTQALQLLDSIDVAYRDCIDQRRLGTRLRIETLIALTSDSISADQSRRQLMETRLDSLQRLFMNVDLQGTEGYSVHKQLFNSSTVSRTAVQPRVDETGALFLIVNVQGRRIGLNSISVGDSVASGESFDMEGSEMMSLSQEAAMPVADAVAGASTPVTIQLRGAKGNTSVRLSAAEAAAWRDTRDYARLLSFKHLSDIRREKYESQLATLTDQLASLDTPETEKDMQP